MVIFLLCNLIHVVSAKKRCVVSSSDNDQDDYDDDDDDDLQIPISEQIRASRSRRNSHIVSPARQQAIIARIAERDASSNASIKVIFFNFISRVLLSLISDFYSDSYVLIVIIIS